MAETMGRMAWSILRRALLGAALALAPAVATAEISGPPPSVSRVLDALLVPVDAATSADLGVADTDTGLLILALDPAGTAASLGLQPGSVIGTVGDTPLVEATDLDQIVAMLLAQGVTEIEFGIWQAGALAALPAPITRAAYDDTFDIVTLTTWTSWTVTSFDYESYVTTYAEEIEVSYEESQVLIEETLSEEAVDTVTEDEAVTDEDDIAADDPAADEAADDDGASDDTGDTGDTGDTDDTDDTGEEQVDDGGDEGGDEGGGDDAEE